MPVHFGFFPVGLKGEAFGDNEEAPSGVFAIVRDDCCLKSLWHTFTTCTSPEMILIPVVHVQSILK